MAAYSDGNGTLKFHNLGSILAVNVSGMTKVEKIEVIADGTTKINGTCDLSNVTTDSPALSAPTTGTNTTTLLCNGVTVPSTGMTFYIALPPVSAKLTIKVDDGYSIYTRTQGSTMSFASNCGYNVPFASSAASEEPYAPKPNQIWYTSSNGTINNFNNVGNLESNVLNSTLGYYIATYEAPITSIPVRCFLGNGDLTGIILPEGVTTIEYDAFNRCGSLSNVVLPYSVTYIEQSAFWYCTNLQTLEIPNPNVKLENPMFLYNVVNFNDGISTIILHTNNPFTDEDISDLRPYLDMAQDTYNDAYERYYQDFLDWEMEEAEAAEQAAAMAYEEAMGGIELWSFAGDHSRITVYVPDVNACTSMSYNFGYVNFMGGDYIYKPWQYMIDAGQIQLLPLSSLPQ